MKMILVFVYVLAFATTVVAQTSLPWSTFSTGHGMASADSASVEGLAGQMFVGGMDGDSVLVGGGFFFGFTPANALVSTTVTNGWNLVSVPLTVGDYAKLALYPSAVSNAYAYEGGYLVKDTLTTGVGYWMKFDGSQSVSIGGFLRDQDTITVVQGWNLIGSISHPVPVSTIVSSPSGIVTSQFFGFSGSYENSDTIQAGKAYWVKTDQVGTLVLSASGPSAIANRIRIVAIKEEPPPVPGGMMGHEELPRQYSLEQNSPNPFNPVTVIRYQLPVPSQVTIKIYNLLGEEVRTLVDEVRSAGYQRVEWNAANNAGVRVSSGVYFYRIDARSTTEANHFFTQVKKMMVLQ